VVFTIVKAYIPNSSMTQLQIWILNRGKGKLFSKI